MDRFKQKLKKDKSIQNNMKEKCVEDVKCIRENIKIREILRNVKMNSSMRLKAPTGSKVMNSKDFSDSEDYLEETHKGDSNDVEEPPYAINPDVISDHIHVSDVAGDSIESPTIPDKPTNAQLSKCRSNSETNLTCTVKSATDYEKHRPVKFESIKRSESMVPDVRTVKEILNNLPTAVRNRKLSLDQSALNRCFSQSELDLHTLGKSPLERKSSFFRKKMDSFLRNTTHLFKKQSAVGQHQRIGIGSKSLQSLDENSLANDRMYLQNSPQQEMHSVSRSTTSLFSDSTVASSSSSPHLTDQPLNHSLAESLTTLSIQNLDILSSNGINHLNESYIQEAMLTSRAISMSSGLDNTSHQRRKSRANRVTWLASEGLTNYFRRVIQDEKSKEKMKSYHSYQDFSSIPENESYGSGTDSKGRRLSYQRAVSGEDPVFPAKHQDSTLRRKHLISEKSEGNYELQNHLAEFSKSGVPALQGFLIATIPENSFSYLMWSEQAGNLEVACDWKKLDENEQKKQAVIRELVETEANYIQHLMVIVEVFIAAAHSLQDSGKMLDIDTARLFSNIPDLLNANLIFWNLTFYPMVKDAVENKTSYKVELMADGFSRFQEIFQPYEKYMYDQSKMVVYLRSIQNDPEFSMYLNWCYSNKSCNRLQLADLLVKPMQRLTKYSLILCRVAAHATSAEESVAIKAMESYVKCYVTDLNRSMRQRDELDKIDELVNSIEPYEVDFKDEEMERAFRSYCALNLRAPMLRSTGLQLRTLLYECDLRFKDNVGKETEIRLFLLTDMMLICKKQSKATSLPYRMIRPKIFLERLFPWSKSSKSHTQSNSLVYIIVDDCCTAIGCFTLSESSKDPTAAQTLKTLELKIKEAHITRSMYLWATMNPTRDLSEMESSDTSGIKVKSSEETTITNEARERVASMLHRGMGVSTDECSQSIGTDSNEAAGGVSSGRMSSQRQYMHRLSTASSRQSRLSSFQQTLSDGDRPLDAAKVPCLLANFRQQHKMFKLIHTNSATSRDEPQPGPSKVIYRACSSLEQPVTSITVDIVNELDTSSSRPEPLVADGLTVHVTPAPESPNSLSPHPQNNVSVLSRPDVSPESISVSFRPPSPSASERLYQSHQELLQRNRLAASQSNQYLTPDHRGSSYPPPSPTRASLKRGMAFSYSFKNPPLTKMGNVHSQSQLDSAASALQQPDRQPSPSLSEKSDKKNRGSRDKATSSIDPDESAVSSTCQTRYSSFQDIAEGGAEKYRSDEEVE